VGGLGFEKNLFFSTVMPAKKGKGSRTQKRRFIGPLTQKQAMQKALMRNKHILASAGRKAKGKKRPGSGRSKQYATRSVSDGLNRGEVITNKHLIIDRFKPREELVANISGSSAFTLVQQLWLNPGNTVLFPLFSQIAACYEQYRVRTLKFHFRTEAYTAVSSTASAGKVIMATNFDVSDPNFVTAKEAEDYCGMSRGMVYSSFTHDVVAGKRNRSPGRGSALPLNDYFMYSSANLAGPTGDSGKFYDIGNFQMITSSNAVTTEIGELYVEYAFDMIRPKLPVPGTVSSALLYAHVRETAAGTASAASPLGTNGTVGLSTKSTLPVVTTSNTFTMPIAGNFYVSLNWQGTTIAAVPSLSLGANLTSDIADFKDAGANSFVQYGADGSWASYQVGISVSASGVAAANTVTIGGLTGMAAFSYCDLYITQLPASFNARPTLSILDQKIAKLEKLMARFDVADLEYDNLSSVSQSVSSSAAACAGAIQQIIPGPLSNRSVVRLR